MDKPLFCWKELSYKKTKGRRIIEVEIGIDNALLESKKVYYLRIRMFYPKKEDFVTIMTFDKPISKKLCNDDKKIIRYVKNLKDIKKLTRAYLDGKNIIECVKSLHKTHRITSIENTDYCLYDNFNWVSLLAYKYNYCLMLKNRHHFFAIVKDLLQFQDVDLKKRTVIQVSTLISDIVKSIGVKHYDVEDGEDTLFFHICKKGKELDWLSYVPITETIIERKVTTGNHFDITSQTKREFGIAFARYAFMQVKAHIIVEIDDDFNILKADIYKNVA